MMNRQNIFLGRILGIPIGLDYSWFLIFVLLSWMLAVDYFPAEFKHWPVWEYWLAGTVTSVMLFVSVLLHELGHSLVARRFKLPVRRITLFVFGGVAEIVGEPPSAWSEFWIALAGPLVSFALGAFFHFVQPLFSSQTALFAIVKYLAFINLILALFNLIPGFPLDGGRIFRAIIWGVTRNLRKSTVIAGTVGRFIAFLFIFVGVMQIFAGRVADGLWTIFIGWFLESAAASQIHQQELRDVLSHVPVARAMNRYYRIIPANSTLLDLVREHILGEGRRYLIVMKGEQLVGMLTLHHLKKIPQEDWANTTAEEVMIPLSQLKWITPDTSLWEALKEMDQDGVNQLPVIQDGNLVGVLSREDLVTFLRQVHELNH